MYHAPGNRTYTLIGRFLHLNSNYIPLHVFPLRLARRYKIPDMPLDLCESPVYSKVPRERLGLTRSVTFLFRSNSALAKFLVSARVLLSGMRCVARTMVR